MVSKKKESIVRVRMGLKNSSLAITVCHHSLSLVIPFFDPQDGFFYPTLTIMMDSYNPTYPYRPIRKIKTSNRTSATHWSHVDP